MTHNEIMNASHDTLRERRATIVRRMTYGIGDRVAMIAERDDINARIDAITRDAS